MAVQLLWDRTSTSSTNWSKTHWRHLHQVSSWQIVAVLLLILNEILFGFAHLLTCHVGLRCWERTRHWNLSSWWVHILLLRKTQWIITSGSQVLVGLISLAQLISNLGHLLFLLRNLRILVDVHQISDDTSPVGRLLLHLLLRQQFFPACVHFITGGHVVVEVLVYDLVLLLNLLSLIALASSLVIQTLFNHGHATSLIASFVNILAISIVAIARGQELRVWLLDGTGSAVLRLSTSDQQLTLLTCSTTMLVNNIDLAILSLRNILAWIHQRLVCALFFELSLLGAETLV